MLMQAIIFFQLKLKLLKIFNTIIAGAELVLATALTSAASITFSIDKKCIYSNPVS